MSAVLLSGKEMAAALAESQAARCEALKQKGIVPQLAVIMAGDDPASAVYVRNKERACQRVGIASRAILLSADVSQGELAAEQVDSLAAEEFIHVHFDTMTRGEIKPARANARGLV